MARTKVNKVGAGETTKPEEKKEKGRVAFPIKDAMYRQSKENGNAVVTAVNGDGLLIAVPKPLKDDAGKIIYAGFNSRKHLPLKKSDFASIVEHIRYQAYIARLKAVALIKSAEEKEAKADRIAKFGDDATRKKAQKVARMREQLKLLEQGLVEEGVDITLI